MIGQALSAITLGFTARKGEKIASPELLRQRIDGWRIVKERFSELKYKFSAAARQERLPCGRGQHSYLADTGITFADAYCEGNTFSRYNHESVEELEVNPSLEARAAELQGDVRLGTRAAGRAVKTEVTQFV